MPFLTNDPLPQCLQQSSAMGASTLGGHERDVSAISLKLSVSEVLENNVQAAAKYMRFVLDTFFPDAGMDPFDRTMFAFASYNAGPARIAGLRRQAAGRGLDPDRWFGQVERVVAERIGRETVQYVSNILKYYVVYRRVAELQARKERALEAARTRPS